MTTLFLAIATLLLFHQAPPTQSPSDGITEKEALEFARRIERDQAEGRTEAFDAIFDVEGMIDEAAAGLELTPKEKRDFAGGYRSMSFGKVISAAEGNSYRFLRMRRVDGRRVLTFRLWGAGLNYHDLHIKKSPRGLRVADMFVYMGGEWIGASARRTLMAVAAGDPDRRAKLPAWAAEWSTVLPKLSEFIEEARGEKPGRALAMFDTYPEAVKGDRMIQTVRILAAARAGDAEHVKAAADYARRFPGDACRDIVCLDALILRKEFGKAHESLDRIDKAIEGDPILDFVRGRLHFMDGKHAPAREAAHKVVKNLPDLEEPHWLLIEISLKEKKYGETVERLNALEKAMQARVKPETLESDPEYADFLKSAEGREWIKSRAPAK